METDLLQISHVSFQYKGAKEAALTDVSLTAKRGEILGLLGPNGAGKTTLISHLSALLSVQSGEILIDGEPFAKVHHHTPTRISVAPQEYAFYPMLTVVENLQCFAAACDLAADLQKTRVQACLDFAQLNHFASTRAQNLSGGLKRRLNLAIAVLAQPDLYLFDEPTVGVDPQSRAFILEAIKHLASQGAAIIYTSHYMEEIEAIADRVAILDRGRLLCCDTLSNLLQQGAMTVRFQVKENSSFTPDHPSYAALQAFGHLQADGTHHILSLRPNTPLSQVFAAMEISTVAIHDMQVGRATLEHVFMTLTDRNLRDD